MGRGLWFRLCLCRLGHRPVEAALAEPAAEGLLVERSHQRIQQSSPLRVPDIDAAATGTTEFFVRIQPILAL
jgi:hypothetical protein